MLLYAQTPKFEKKFANSNTILGAVFENAM